LATQEQDFGGLGRRVEAARLEIRPLISQAKLHRLYLARGGTGEVDAFKKHLHDKAGGFNVNEYAVVSKLVNDLLEHCGKERLLPEIGDSFPDEGSIRMMFDNSPFDLHFRDRLGDEAGSVTGRITPPVALAG